MKRLRVARIDELADSQEPANMSTTTLTRWELPATRNMKYLLKNNQLITRHNEIYENEQFRLVNSVPGGVFTKAMNSKTRISNFSFQKCLE